MMPPPSVLQNNPSLLVSTPMRLFPKSASAAVAVKGLRLTAAMNFVNFAR